jgi:membrane protein DedA with SNARE-associated domain/rhodanese-related sulfurtransferase
MNEISQLLAQYGPALIFLIVFMEQIGLPTPAIPALTVAGALAADGKLSAPELFGVGIAATLIADSVWYAAGRHYGNRVMKVLCRVSLTPESCVSQTQTLFERWGLNALLIANFIPGLATIAPPLAGATGIGWPRFLFLSTLGASLRVGAGLGVGMVFKEQIERILGVLERTGAAAIIVVGALFVTYIACKWWDRQRFFAKLRVARINVDELYASDGHRRGTGNCRCTVTHRLKLETRRIPRARHVPLQAVDQSAKELPRDREIILYCTCPNEVSAAEVTKLLMNSGFKRVCPLYGGLDAWIAAGDSVEAIQVASP